MRKLLSIVLTLLLLAIPALPANTPYQVGQVFTSLNAVAATGAGTGAIFSTGQFAGSYPAMFTWQTIYTGTPTAINVNLEGSLDGTNWFTLDSSTSTASEMRHVVNKPIRFLRCNISSYTVNGSTASCQFTAGKF